MATNKNAATQQPATDWKKALTPQDFLTDPGFHSLSPEDKKSTLLELNPKSFGSLKDSDWEDLLSRDAGFYRDYYSGLPKPPEQGFFEKAWGAVKGAAKESLAGFPGGTIKGMMAGLPKPPEKQKELKPIPPLGPVTPTPTGLHGDIPTRQFAPPAGLAPPPQMGPPTPPVTPSPPTAQVQEVQEYAGTMIPGISSREVRAPTETKEAWNFFRSPLVDVGKINRTMQEAGDKQKWEFIDPQAPGLGIKPRQTPGRAEAGIQQFAAEFIGSLSSPAVLSTLPVFPIAGMMGPYVTAALKAGWSIPMAINAVMDSKGAYDAFNKGNVEEGVRLGLHAITDSVFAFLLGKGAFKDIKGERMVRKTVRDGIEEQIKNPEKLLDKVIAESEAKATKRPPGAPGPTPGTTSPEGGGLPLSPEMKGPQLGEEIAGEEVTPEGRIVQTKVETKPSEVKPPGEDLLAKVVEETEKRKGPGTPPGWREPKEVGKGPVPEGPREIFGGQLPAFLSGSAVVKKDEGTGELNLSDVKGKPVIMFPSTVPTPKIPDNLKDKVKAINTDVGTFWVRTADGPDMQKYVRQEVNNGTWHELLGAESPAGPESAKTVVVRDKDGNIIQSIAAKPEEADKVVDNLKKQFPDAASIGVHDTKQVVPEEVVPQRREQFELKPPPTAEPVKAAGLPPREGIVTGIPAGGRLKKSPAKGKDQTISVDPMDIKVPNEVEQDERARPWSLGQFEGKKTSEVIDRIHEHMNTKPDEPVAGRGDQSTRDGESFNAFRASVGGLIKDAVQDLRDNPYSTKVTVTHFRDIKAIESWVKAGAPADFSIDPKEMERADGDPGSVYRLHIKKDGVHFDRVNLSRLITLLPGRYFVRHGMTDWNEGSQGKHPFAKTTGEDFIRGSSDIKLNKQGESDAENIGRQFARLGGFDQITASPYQRATRTAQIILDQLQATKGGLPKPTVYKTARATKEVVSEPGYAYHATNLERASEIQKTGMWPHKPWEFTDQNTWPDGSTELRSYFSKEAPNVWQFAPEEGPSVVLRVNRKDVKLIRESTGDLFSRKVIHPEKIEILTEKGEWKPLIGEKPGLPHPPELLKTTRIERKDPNIAISTGTVNVPEVYDFVAKAKIIGAEGETRAVAGMDPRTMKVLGGNLYSGDLGVIVVKECLQNGIDALRGLTDPSLGSIDFNVGMKNMTVIVSDNGTGMLPEVATKEFVDIGGSRKTEGSSGGFGIAKVAIFTNSDEINIVTRAFDDNNKLIETQLTGSGEDWMDPTKGLRVTSYEVSSKSYAPGTMLRLKLTKESRIGEWSIEEYIGQAIAANRTPFTITGSIGGRDIRKTRDVVSLSRSLDVPGSKVEILVSEESRSRSCVDVEILNRGIYQFSKSIWLPNPVVMPSRIVADIAAINPPDHPNYPFRPDREGLRGPTGEAIDNYILKDLYIDAAKKEQGIYIEALKKAKVIPGTDMRVLDTQQDADPSKVEIIARSQYAREIMETVKLSLKEMAARLDKIDPGRGYLDVILSGIGLGNDYLGLNIQGSYVREDSKNDFLLINLGSILREVDSLVSYGYISEKERAEMFGNQVMSTLVHELTHKASRSHNEDFAGHITRNFGRLQTMIRGGSYKIAKAMERNNYAYWDQIKQDWAELDATRIGGENIFRKISIALTGPGERIGLPERPSRGGRRGIGLVQAVRSRGEGATGFMASRAEALRSSAADRAESGYRSRLHEAESLGKLPEHGRLVETPLSGPSVVARIAGPESPESTPEGRGGRWHKLERSIPERTAVAQAGLAPAPNIRGGGPAQIESVATQGLIPEYPTIRAKQIIQEPPTEEKLGMTPRGKRAASAMAAAPVMYIGDYPITIWDMDQAFDDKFMEDILSNPEFKSSMEMTKNLFHDMTEYLGREYPAIDWNKAILSFFFVKNDAFGRYIPTKELYGIASGVKDFVGINLFECIRQAERDRALRIIAPKDLGKKVGSLVVETLFHEVYHNYLPFDNKEFDDRLEEFRIANAGALRKWEKETGQFFSRNNSEILKKLDPLYDKYELTVGDKRDEPFGHIPNIAEPSERTGLPPRPRAPPKPRVAGQIGQTAFKDAADEVEKIILDIGVDPGMAEIVFREKGFDKSIIGPPDLTTEEFARIYKEASGRMGLLRTSDVRRKQAEREKQLKERMGLKELGDPVTFVRGWVTYEGEGLPSGRFEEGDLHLQNLEKYLMHPVLVQDLPKEASRAGLMRVEGYGEYRGAEFFGKPSPAQLLFLARMEKAQGIQVEWEITSPLTRMWQYRGEGVKSLMDDLGEDIGLLRAVVSRPGGGIPATHLPRTLQVKVLANEKYYQQAGYKKVAKGLDESIRTYFAGEEDVRKYETNQLAGKWDKIIQNPIDRQAVSLVREFRSRPGELQQFLDGIHPKYDDYAHYWHSRHQAATAQQVAAARADAVTRIQELRPIIVRAINPSAEMMQVANEASVYFADRLQEGKDLGFLDSSISPEEYVNHIMTYGIAPDWEDLGTSGGPPARAAMPQTVSFANRRTFASLLEAEIFSPETHVKPASYDLIDLMRIYGAKEGRIAATKLLQELFSQAGCMRYASSKKQLLDENPEEYRDWEVFTADSGDPLWRVTRPYKDKNDEAKISTKFAFGPSNVVAAIRPILKKYGLDFPQWYKRQTAWVKAINVAISAFHMRALSNMALYNHGPVDIPGHMITREFRQLNIFAAFKNFGKALKLDLDDLNFQSEEKDGIRHGLTTPASAAPIEAYKNVLGDDDDSMRHIIETFEKASLKPSEWKTMGNAARAIGSIPVKLAERLTHITFDVMQRKFKVYGYSLLKAGWLAANPEPVINTPEHIRWTNELTAAKKSISKEINATFGGLNWTALQPMYFGEKNDLRGLLRGLIFAPDWFISNISQVMEALSLAPVKVPGTSWSTKGKGRWGPTMLPPPGAPGGPPPPTPPGGGLPPPPSDPDDAMWRRFVRSTPGGIASRWFIFRTLVYGMVINQMFSVMMSGHLSQKPFEVYFGKDKDGNDIYANWSFSGMPGDVVNLCRYIYEFGAIGGPMFIAGKTAFWPRVLIQVVTGKTYFGAMYRKGVSGLASTLRAAWFAITSMMPFSTSTPLQMVMGKEREYSFPEYLSNIIMGGRTRHTPPEGYEAVRSGYKYGTLKKIPETEPRSLVDQVLTGRPFKPTMQQLRHMDLRSAVDALERLSDAEKLKYRGIIMMKYGNLRRYTPDVRRQIIQKMNDEGILTTGRGLPPPPQ